MKVLTKAGVEYAEMKISEHFPMWQQTIRTKTFRKWLMQQSQEVQRKARSLDYPDSIDVLNKFTTETSKKNTCL